MKNDIKTGRLSSIILLSLSGYILPFGERSKSEKNILKNERTIIIFIVLSWDWFFIVLLNLINFFLAATFASFAVFFIET